MASRGVARGQMSAPGSGVLLFGYWETETVTTTTKRDLIKRVADKTGHKQSTTKVIVQVFLDEITAELARGRRLEFREFGIFEPVYKKARMARNPRTGASVPVPAKTVVHFKVGRLMRKLVREGGATLSSASESLPAAEGMRSTEEPAT